MVEIHVTPAELESCQLTDAHLNLAKRTLDEDGIVVLCDVIDPEHVRVLRERMLTDVEAYLARDDKPFNWNPGNLQQAPPPFEPYLFRDVTVNDLVIQVTRSVLGNGMKNAFYSGNTALPGEHRQPVHADIGQLWPGLRQATPAYGLVVNVPVVDMGPENGSTEVWPGTHRDTSVSISDGEIEVAPEVLDARRATHPPIQPVVKAGSVVIRDLRMWHAGMPNRTQTPRPMIAMIHYTSWWNAGEPMELVKGTESYFEHPHLYWHAKFIEREVDYVGATGGYMSS